MEPRTHPLVNIFEQVGVVGSGRFGRVYKVKIRDDCPEELKPENGFEHYALKRIGLDSWEEVKEIERESIALRSLRSDHIPAYVGFFEAEDPTFGNPEYMLAMQFIDGDNLSKRLAKGETFYESRVTRILDESLEALAEAHSKNIVHRDMKPGNIIIRNEDGRTYVTDFGLAKLTEQTSRMSSFGAGTLAYQAPEQLGENDPKITPETDYYGLGLTAIALLNGEERKKDMRFQDPLEDLARARGISDNLRQRLQYLVSVDPLERRKGLSEVVTTQITSSAQSDVRVLNDSVTLTTATIMGILSPLMYPTYVRSVISRGLTSTKKYSEDMGLAGFLLGATFAMAELGFLRISFDYLPHFSKLVLIGSNAISAGSELVYWAHNQDPSKPRIRDRISALLPGDSAEYKQNLRLWRLINPQQLITHAAKDITKRMESGEFITGRSITELYDDLSPCRVHDLIDIFRMIKDTRYSSDDNNSAVMMDWAPDPQKFRLRYIFSGSVDNVDYVYTRSQWGSRGSIAGNATYVRHRRDIIEFPDYGQEAVLAKDDQTQEFAWEIHPPVDEDKFLGLVPRIIEDIKESRSDLWSVAQIWPHESKSFLTTERVQQFYEKNVSSK